jgi:phenylpyruvate tautomerase PptA (4-oxalocrotonate tautomerase family)
MPIVEITGLAFPQEAKDRIAKKVTEMLAEEEKTAFKVDATAITVVLFRELKVQDLFIGAKPLAKVIETLPKVK